MLPASAGRFSAFANGCASCGALLPVFPPAQRAVPGPAASAPSGHASFDLALHAEGALPYSSCAKRLLELYLSGIACPERAVFQHRRAIMDFFFFFVGIIAVACALTYIKKTSPNKHH